ncbi:MAG: DapH/DapD/GlmU-related protein [Thermodesulfobacteriota bacterium]
MNYLKRFATPIQTIMTFGLFIQISIIAGLAATPGVFVAIKIYEWSLIFNVPEIVRIFSICFLSLMAYFSYILCVIIIIPLMRVFSPGSPEGRYPVYSSKAIKWASYNALILMVRFTCMNFIKVTPFINLFFRLMGMKLGKRVQINSPIIGDSNLITIGDDTVIGGDVTLTPHVVEGDILVVERIHIGSRVSVGLMSVVMPGCQIGDDATIAANTVLKKGSIVAPGEIWAGVPGRKIGEKTI